MLRRQYAPYSVMYVLDLGVEIPEDGIHDVEKCGSDVNLYMYMKGAFFGFMNS